MSTLGKKTVEDIEVKGRNVLVRCDFNVPMKDGVIVGHGAPRELLTTDFLRALYEVEAEILSGRDGAMRVFFYSK